LTTNEAWRIEADRLYEAYKGADNVYARIAQALRERGLLCDVSYEKARSMVRGRYRYQKEPTQEAPTEDTVTEKLVQAQKEKLVSDNHKRVLADLTKRAAINELILEKIASAVVSIPYREFQPRYVQYKGKDLRSTEEIILTISDIQAGVPGAPWLPGRDTLSTSSCAVVSP